MKDFKKYIIQTEPFHPEQLSDLLWSLDIQGVIEEDNCLSVFVEVGGTENLKSITDFLNTLVEQNLFHSFEIDEELVEDKNWNEEFEKKTQVVEVSDKIIIKPTFRDYEAKEGQVVIVIDPKMSFGTGEHETTRLVLQMMEKHVKGGERVIDVGSGTAVLAIGSVLLGAETAIGIDNDEWCRLNGNENIKLNNVEDKVEARLGVLSDVEEKDFDLILANINKHILLDIKEQIKDKVNQAGLVILSGLMDVDENDIVESYTQLGFEVVDKIQLNEWISLVLKTK